MEDVEDVFRTADNEAEGNLWFLVQEGAAAIPGNTDKVKKARAGHCIPARAFRMFLRICGN